MIDSIFNPFFRLKISRTYDAILATPLEVTDIALGEVLWALVRATMYAASFIICMALLGDAGSPWVILCWPGAILTSFRLQLFGLAACTYIRSWQDFDKVAIVQMPLFLFSATFFPITLYPRWLGAIVLDLPALPIGDVAARVLTRAFDWIMIMRASYLSSSPLSASTLRHVRFQRI